MPRRERYAPKHRAALPDSVDPSPRGHARARRAALLTGVAVAATGVAVSSGVVRGGQGAATAAPAEPATLSGTSAADAPAELARRATTVSRSLSRTSTASRVDRVKRTTLTQKPGGATTRTEDLASGDPRDIARALLPQFGFGADQFSCLDSIYVNESGWNPRADNPSSSAYGIPQALPGSKMASAGSDWATNPATQIKWGLGYIKGRYGTPCSAWGFKQSHGWY